MFAMGKPSGKRILQGLRQCLGTAAGIGGVVRWAWLGLGALSSCLAGVSPDQ